MLIYRGKGSLKETINPQIISITDLEKSNFLHLKQIKYIESNSVKTWDIVNAHDSVAILLYDNKNNGFVFVRQLRINVFNMHKNAGLMYELCAGIIDKPLSNEEIARQEIEEECGYLVNKLKYITTFFSSANGSKQILYFAFVSDEDRVNSGGGNSFENENIECIFVPKDLALEFLEDENCSKNQALSYAVLWFLFQNKI